MTLKHQSFLFLIMLITVDISFSVLISDKYFVELPESFLNLLKLESTENENELWHPRLRLSPIGDDIFTEGKPRKLEIKHNYTNILQPRSFLQIKTKIHDPEEEVEYNNGGGLQGQDTKMTPHMYCKCKFVKAPVETDTSQELPDSTEDQTKQLFEPQKSIEENNAVEESISPTVHLQKKAFSNIANQKKFSSFIQKSTSKIENSDEVQNTPSTEHKTKSAFGNNYQNPYLMNPNYISNNNNMNIDYNSQGTYKNPNGYQYNPYQMFYPFPIFGGGLNYMGQNGDSVMKSKDNNIQEYKIKNKIKEKKAVQNYQPINLNQGGGFPSFSAGQNPYQAYYQYLPMIDPRAYQMMQSGFMGTNANGQEQEEEDSDE